jgi:hypothetical protein
VQLPAFAGIAADSSDSAAKANKAYLAYFIKVPLQGDAVATEIASTVARAVGFSRFSPDGTCDLRPIFVHFRQFNRAAGGGLPSKRYNGHDPRPHACTVAVGAMRAEMRDQWKEATVEIAW